MQLIIFRIILSLLNEISTLEGLGIRVGGSATLVLFVVGALTYPWYRCQSRILTGLGDATELAEACHIHVEERQGLGVGAGLGSGWA